MGRNAWLDIEAEAPRVVFVVLTAGDEGLGLLYAQARESGHERALRFWGGLSGRALDKTEKRDVQIRGFSLERWKIGAFIVAYNLRLPDGSPDGTGYPRTGNESLEKLRDDPVSEMIESIDHRLRLTYGDLITIVRGILSEEAKGSKDVWVNIQDEDGFRNPLDHADHKATALTVLDAIRDSRYACVSVARYTTYVNAVKWGNLDPGETMIHAGTWGALNSGRIDGFQPTTWDTIHLAWLGREYLRIEKSKKPCSF